MSHSAALHLLRKRPWTMTSLVGVSSSVSYAHYVEHQTVQQDQRQMLKKTHETKHSDSCLEGGLPRTYDKPALDEYWKGRPVTVVKRFMNIVSELGPRMGAYVYDFVLFGDTNNHWGDGGIERTQRQHAIELRNSLTNLGPAFVKAGQQLSIRPDLVPPVVLKELQKLCDAVKPVPDEVAMQVLKEELECEDLDDVFDNIRMVASASLGQVYKATLSKTQQEVAIKIQRPDIVSRVTLDLWILSKWGVFMDGFTSTFTQQKPFHVAFLDAYCSGSYQELDYENEADNQHRFQREFAKRNSRVVVPDVFDDLSTQRVLTSEWINGVKLADAPKKQIQDLIPVGVELFLTQLLDIGSFHADPHPGNLYVTDEGTLCLLDFGLCAEVDERSRRAMTTAIVHLLTGDFDSLVKNDAKELGFLPHDLDTKDLQPLLTKVLTEGLLEGGSNLKTRKRKLMEISNELNDLFFRYPFSVPPFFALVTRGLGLLEGIALSGDPNFDIFQASYPYASKRAMHIMGSHSLNRMRRKLTSNKTTIMK